MAAIHASARMNGKAQSRISDFTAPLSPELRKTFLGTVRSMIVLLDVGDLDTPSCCWLSAETRTKNFWPRQAKSSWRAAFEMATTAGFFNRRSTEIA